MTDEKKEEEEEDTVEYQRRRAKLIEEIETLTSKASQFVNEGGHYHQAAYSAIKDLEHEAVRYFRPDYEVAQYASASEAALDLAKIAGEFYKAANKIRLKMGLKGIDIYGDFEKNQIK